MAETSTIKIRRGLFENLPSLEIGELGFATDTNQLFVGKDDGLGGTINVLISDIGDFYTKTQIQDLDGTGILWDAVNTKFKLDFADASQALDDTNELKAMNPKRTAEMIDSRVGATLTSGSYATQGDVDGAVASIGGTGLTWDGVDSVYNIDNPFDPSGTYQNLVAQGTTAADVGLGNVDNESKAIMFTDPTFTGAVTVRDPINPTDAANKKYVDEVGEGIRSAPAVHLATTENLSGTYSNGTAGVGATLNLGPLATLTIDGDSSWDLYDGLLIKDQTNKAENGRYVLTQIGDGTTDWIFTRCTVCDEADEIPGRYVFVVDGTVNTGTGWVQVVDDPDTFVVGTDDIDVYQFSGAGTYTADNGLTLNGTAFSIDTSIVMDLTSNQTIGGTKTFSSTIVGDISGNANTTTNQNSNSGINNLKFWQGTLTQYNTETSSGANAATDTLYFIEEE